MDISNATKARGGSCENAYGGHFRLDKFELLATGDGKTEPLEMVFRQVILDAVSSYIFFGLGRNGYVADEFLMAYAYFFSVTSDRPEMWNRNRKVQVTDNVRCGVSTAREFMTLTDDQMQDGCFDRHYEMAGLDRSMSLSRFRKLLKVKRRNIVESNFEQVKSYLQTIRKQAASRGEYLKTGTYHGDLLDTLVSPTDEALASLLYPIRQVPKVSHRRPFRMPRRERGCRRFVYADRDPRMQDKNV